MLRRSLLTTAAAWTTVGSPRLGRAGRVAPLRFVPVVGLTMLDPTFIGVPHTRSHGYLVFDTLYGLDENFVPHPQMVEGHTVDADGTVWQLTLREGLRFHDGTPVLARDAVASIRRCGLREGFCQALLAATDELAAVDDRRLRFRLKRPFPQLPQALAGLATITPVILPERLASTDPAKPIQEMVGSGPYRFIAGDFVIGERAAYERFPAYAPRPDGVPSYTAGPKVAHLERIEWVTIDDAATAASALRKGEVDWLQAVSPDQAPALAGDSGVRTDVTEPAGSIGIMRFNHLHPPFDDPAIRRALLDAVDQANTMRAVAGTDRRYWRDRVGLFHDGTPFANDIGLEAIAGPPDYAAVRQALAKAGYRGEQIVVLGTMGSGYIPALTQVGADWLRLAGMKVDLQLSDYATMARRIGRMDPPEHGGWHVYFTPVEGAFTHTPVTNEYFRGDGRSGAPGWARSPEIEAIRPAWLAAESNEQRMKVAEAAQRRLWIDVPYIPMGQWLRVTAYRHDLAGIPRGFAAF
jgi:peptide/nickel transport system substrate-binding protein